jgi:hypothetical protein
MNLMFVQGEKQEKANALHDIHELHVLKTLDTNAAPLFMKHMFFWYHLKGMTENQLCYMPKLSYQPSASRYEAVPAYGLP